RRSNLVVATLNIAASMTQSPQVSPDGAYWWDGQAWRPMPMPRAPEAAELATPPMTRPSWLPEGVEAPAVQVETGSTSSATVATQGPIPQSNDFASPSPSRTAVLV